MIAMEAYNEHFQRCDGRHQITQHIRYATGYRPCPSGRCFLRSQRRIRWEHYTQSRAKIYMLAKE